MLLLSSDADMIFTSVRMISISPNQYLCLSLYGPWSASMNGRKYMAMNRNQNSLAPNNPINMKGIMKNEMAVMPVHINTI